MYTNNFEFRNQICPKRVISVENEKSEHHHWILHLNYSRYQISLFPKKMFSVASEKSGHHYWILHIWISLGTNFQLMDTLKAFDDFKNKQKGVGSNVFWYVKVCHSETVFNILYTCHKTQMLKKIPSDKIKMPSFFFREPQLITILLLIYDSYVSFTLCVGISNFDSVFFLLKFIFLLNKTRGLFDFKTS